MIITFRNWDYSWYWQTCYLFIYYFFYVFCLNCIFQMSWEPSCLLNQIVPHFVRTRCHCSTSRKAKDCENCYQQGNKNIWRESDRSDTQVFYINYVLWVLTHFHFHFWLFHMLWFWCSFALPYSCNLISIGQFTILELFWSYFFFILHNVTLCYGVLCWHKCNSIKSI